eukprot:5728774-Pleurochrysis_carterae.AAC.1
MLRHAPGSACAALATRVQVKAAGLELTGVLGPQKADEWLHGAPTVEQTVTEGSRQRKVHA